MEKYSFIKYLNLKENKLNKYKNFLNMKIQTGGEGIELRTLQKELLKIRLRLQQINSAKKNSLFDPYPELKTLIDSINRMTDDKEIQAYAEQQVNDSSILNKIKEIDLLINTTATDYTTMMADKKLAYVKEQLDASQVGKVFEKYITDTEALVGTLKTQIGKGPTDLVNNTDIEANIAIIDQKIKQYGVALAQIVPIETRLKEIIGQMESIYDEKLITIEPFEPIKIEDEEYDQIKIKTVDDKTIRFNFQDIDQVELPLKPGETKEDEDTSLIGLKFLKLNEEDDVWGEEGLLKSQLEESPPKPTQVNTSLASLSFLNPLVKGAPAQGAAAQGAAKKGDVVNPLFGLGGKQKYLTDYQEVKVQTNHTMKELYNSWLTKIKKINNNHRENINHQKVNIVKSKINYDLKKINQLGGDRSIQDFIEKLNEFEIFIRNMKEKRREILRSIKKYNVRYSQFMNFQKYIVNYVSLVLAQQEYNYYQYLSKGMISYYDSILTKMEQILDKYENPKFFNIADETLSSDENKWLYIKHFFMIKILRSFLRGLLTYWSGKYIVYNTEKIRRDRGEQPQAADSSSPKAEPESPKPWSLTLTPETLKALSDENLIGEIKKWNNTPYKITLDAKKENGIGNKKYYFLFNIFFRILDGYASKLPPVANYMRINDIPDPISLKDDRPLTFTSKVGNKNKLDDQNVKLCANLTTQKDKDSRSNAMQKLDFAEIFDQSFKDNDSLAHYMGLADSLKKGKSIMLLTYGYSGVGKTFTLFGKVIRVKDEKPTKLAGLLQTVLNNIPGDNKIELKVFELYGLGVPYKFYWSRTDSNFDHFIYHYQITPETTNVIEPTGISPGPDFTNILDRTQKYQILKKTQIDGFSDIIEGIDKIRKATGRIKATLNNPESSRSIMIYDFKITFEDGKSVSFVVMDLPGKENIFQTFCGSNEQNNGYDPKDNFRPRDVFYKYRNGLGYKDNSKIMDGNYNPKMIKTMMYMNPLWLSSIPEIAEYFDEPTTSANKLDPSLKDLNNIPLGATIYKIREENPTYNHLDSFYKANLSNTLRLNSERVLMDHVANAHVQTPHYYGSENLSEFSKIAKSDVIKLGVAGICDRAKKNITKLIQQSKLTELGELINNMLEEKDARDKKYGYAGLEGIYINENILGLLEVLSLKIQEDRIKDKFLLQTFKPKHVVCEQKEIYKELYKREPRIPVDLRILKDKNNITEFNDNGSITYKINNNAPIFVEDDEFFSQMRFFQDNISTSPVGTVFFESTESDPFKTFMRSGPDSELNYANQTKGITKNIEDNKKNWINNYNYNKIFNIRDPPIKSILKPYLDDPQFKNFYLFFVVSNNLKVTKLETGQVVGAPTETCDKQLQLLYDTRHFMDIIAHEDAEGILPAECEAL